jgi:hypothetical protein
MTTLDAHPLHRWLTMTLMLLAPLGVGSCGDDDAGRQRSSDETASSTARDRGAHTPLTPVIDEKLRVGSPRQQLAIRCWGAGKPAVVLDAGSSSGGIESFGALQEELIGPLAKRSTVCAYDRAGTGDTAELPKRRRTIDDQAEELAALLAAAGVPEPRVLVGSSWGGFVAVHTARNEPDGVGGIVLLDVPAGNAQLTAAEAPDAAWEHPINVERVDSFDAERTMARDSRSLGDLPVRVVTADGGQSDKQDQRFWKLLSSNFSHVVLSGGHDIYLDNPDGVVKQIQKAVDAVG